MASIVDDRGYNQGFKDTLALRVRTDRRLDAMIAQMGVGAGGSVLEMGCGTGLLSKRLAEKTQLSVTGMDLCKDFIEEAKNSHIHPRLNFIHFQLGAGNKIPGKYDFIVGNGILHHLYYQLDQFLLEIQENLNPGGRLIFWEPNLYNPYVFLIFKIKAFRKIAKLEPDEMAFTGSFIRNKFKVAGLDQVSVEYRDFLLPNTPPSLIRPIIKLGGFLEKRALVKRMSQSLFISAVRK